MHSGIDRRRSQELPALKKYKASAFDAGDKDMGINDTVKKPDKILSDYGRPHTSEIYEGDHVNRITEQFELKCCASSAPIWKRNENATDSMAFTDIKAL